MRRLLILLFLLVLSPLAQAQKQGGGMWLDADYTFNNITYKNASSTEVGNFAGVRGDLGMNLTQNIGITVGGSYMDGNLNLSGTDLLGSQVQSINKDYFREYYALLNLYYGSATLSGGIAQREWYDDLLGNYRQRQIYNYYPVTLTLGQQQVYFKLEFDIWKSGSNESYMSDLGPAEKNVTFAQNSGTGYGAELGFLLFNTGHFSSRIFVAYHHWNVADSNTLSDNVHTLTITQNNTTILQGGLGISF